MKENKSLAKNAYGGIKGKDYVPFIPTTKAMPELTGYSIIVGILFACIFAAANTYLGLKVGLTISAGIPGAILATGIFRGAFKRNNILEANFASALSAMGESVAAGIIFILPALILAGMNLGIFTIVIVASIGSVMGVFFITPLRRFLIVEEHGVLVYPESMAAAEVLVTASSGGTGFKTVLSGLGMGGIYKLFSGGFAFWKESSVYTFKSFQGTQIGFDALASLIGVGFIVGTEVAVLMFAGSFLAWFGLIPLIKFLGEGLSMPIFPATTLISEMSASDIWGSYIRYIGAGAVAMGGFISLTKNLPTIIKSFREAIAGLGEKSDRKDRIDIEAPITWVILAAALGFFLTWLVPTIGGGIVGGLIAVAFSFFFSVVSARMCGLIGASNNPVSGMTIATLLFTAMIFKLTGASGDSGIIKSILVVGVVCVALAVAGGTSQSLKTTFIIGGTPKSVQLGMTLAAVFGSVFSGLIIIMLNNSDGIGSQAVPAPQATLMHMIAKGIMSAELPWTLVIIGAAIAVVCELIKVPILPVALGIYLPITLNAAILFGGIIRVVVEYTLKKDKKAKSEAVEKGILISSGLVAGDALMGIVIAVFATLNINIAIGSNIMPLVTGSELFPLIMFVLLGIWLFISAKSKSKTNI